MKTLICRIPALFIFLAICTSQAWALDQSGFHELVKLMDSARVAEAGIFAPGAWAKALESFERAEKAIAGGKKQKTLDKHVAKAREFTENALKAAEVAKLSLQEYLKPRDVARLAKAPSLVPELYDKAEKQLTKANAKVESGNVKGALADAEKAVPLFDMAELAAIRVAILGASDRLIEKAILDESKNYAASTLGKAHSARDKCNDILSANRYERKQSLIEAARAEYEASHASNISQSVRSLRRNDQAWEKLILVYEIQMNRVAGAFGLEHLPFDKGPMTAADTLLDRIQKLQAENGRLAGTLSRVTDQLRETVPSSQRSLSAELLADAVVKRVAGLSSKVEVGQTQLAELEQKHEEVSGDLLERKQKEEKFRQAKTMLSPAEGEVLFNASNDIVLRLSGLSFGIGKSEIMDGHMTLLRKVERVIAMFPDAKIAVEGHTDTSGEPAANVQLSEKRAYAVMQYLRGSMLISASRIQSIGYGADRPVASNQTAGGRAKNRRIDIIIMR